VASSNADFAQLEQIVGAPISSIAPGRWGFTNHTDIVTLASGGRVVVQRYRRQKDAGYRLRVMQALRAYEQQIGIAIPEIRRFDLNAEPPWAVFEPLAGRPLPEAGEASLDGPRFPSMARQMGELLRRLRRLPTDGLNLNDAWADPGGLAAHAQAWAASVPELTPEQRATLAQVSARWPALSSNRPAVFAHGDFVPVNVLTDGETLTGLVDFEAARLADPLFDVAWWAWVVEFHHPAGFRSAWPSFLQGAGMDPDEPHLAERIRAIQILRLLELTADPKALSGDMRGFLVNNLQAMLLHRAGAMPG
jgi:aminoglycoside phosphotransferase (APT) family kinase protein